MSTIYDISEKSRNFSQYRDFYKQFSTFDFANQKCSKSGGVPLSGKISENGVKSICVDNEDNHTLIIGPTGTKKSRLIAMPTVRILCAAKESMIISDPKAEIYYRTGSYLQDSGYDVFVVNLREPNLGSCWNPLTIPYQFYKAGDIDRACEFANDISENLAKINTNSNADPFWDNSAGSLFFGLTMLLFKYCVDHKQPDSAVNIGNLICLKNVIFNNDNRLKARVNSPLWQYAKQDFIIASALGGTVVAPNETYGSIMSVFNEKMTLFQIRPSLLNMLSSDSGVFENIDHKPTAVFLILPDEKTAYHGLASLLIKQSYEYIIFKAQMKAGGVLGAGTDVRLNYILDEFSSLPTINDFPAMITAARSRNIRFDIFVQSKHQLELKYGKDADTIQANCGNLIFLSSRELNLLEELSKLCGSANKEKPHVLLVNISDLQRLDKSKGEAFVLSGRLKPHIAKLFDINDYDSLNGKLGIGNGKLMPKSQQNNDSWEKLDFALNEKYCDKHNIPQQIFSTVNSSDNVPMDKIIEQIDREIARLVQEEKEQMQDEPEKKFTDNKIPVESHKEEGEL